MKSRRNDFDPNEKQPKKRDFIKVSLPPRVFPGDPPYTAVLIDPAVDNAVCGALWLHGWAMCDLADGLQEVRGRAVRAFRMGLAPPQKVPEMKALCARIARNHAVDRLRKRSTEEKEGYAGPCADPDEYVPLQLSFEQRDPVDAERQLEVAAELFRQGVMPEHGVDILEGIACDVKYEDVAEDLGISSYSVQGRLKTMRKLFKQQIARRGLK
jgi:DNA-directed RNA polymerase specialized sigma24 family protein